VAPAARFVCTGRAALGIEGEIALPLSALPVDEAVALFVARASVARPGFAVTDHNRGPLRALVTRIGALPLCVELVAARARTLSVSDLVEHLSSRLRSIKGRDGGRQLTLRGVLDWSWSLLSPHEQLALAQVSVFRGGFDLEAAEAVVALPEGDDVPWVEELIEALQEQSLLYVEAPPRAPEVLRFHVCESIRDYAEEKLSDPVAARSRHAAHYALRGDDAAIEALVGPGGPSCVSS
jgi:predicted ATPase